jgi:hypothetical protein
MPASGATTAAQAAAPGVLTAAAQGVATAVAPTALAAVALVPAAPDGAVQAAGPRSRATSGIPQVRLATTVAAGSARLPTT